MGKSKGRKKKIKARNGPPFLSEFSKTATDLLRKDYGSEYKMLRVSTLTASGVAIHSTAVYKRQTPVATVDTVFNYKNTNFNVHFGTIPQLSANLSLSKQIMPSTTVKASLNFPDFSSKISTNFSVSQQVFQYLTAKASLRLPNYNFCKITFCSLHQHAALAMSVGLNNRSPEVAFQASLGTQSLAVGMQTTYRTTSSCFQPWTIGIQGTFHGDTASLLYSTKGNNLKATIFHSLDKEMKFSAVLDIIQSLSTCKTTFTAAGSWAIDDRTVVKARIDHHGTLKTLLRHSIEDYKSLISISGEFDVKDLKKKPKIAFYVIEVLRYLLAVDTVEKIIDRVVSGRDSDRIGSCLGNPKSPLYKDKPFTFAASFEHQWRNLEASIPCFFLLFFFFSPEMPRSGGSSGQRPKRSLNSSGSSDAKKKAKTTTNQKTLGASWGANSLSSSRSSLRTKSPFSDFGSYMVEKNKKLHDQFDAQASNSSNGGSSSSENAIFRGVSIFVDGFTVPSSQELRAYMLKYGGKYENYFSRYRVTHIICSNLPNSKLKNLRSFSGGLPVVIPTWILDSVAANKLLSWVPYLLDQLADNQPRLSAFFAPKILSVSEDALHVKYENECTSHKAGLEDDESLSEVGEGMEFRKKNGAECYELADEKIHAPIEEPTIRSETPLDMVVADTDDSDAEDCSSVKDDAHTSPSPPSASDRSYCSGNQVTKELTNPAAVAPYGSHSTLTDPNFVENYFKNSRLHFIGTWRNRYRKRFPSFSKGSNPPTDSQKTTIIHMDMDCFFVSAVIRKHPELKDKPVAVCHSDNPKGTAEISSANYPARDFGVKAGMFVRDAKALCPHLFIVPYNFEAYEEIADQFYNILHKHCKRVQAVSCDEAFLDATDSEIKDPELLASTIRKEIFETTRCTASAGIAGNMLLSRLATRNAKPDGQCYIPLEKVDDYLDQLPIKALPGIGHVLGEKLKKKNVQTCGQLRIISKESLQKDFGAKTGDMLWNYSRGIDNRPVGILQESKSIGAEVNWGVRFKNPKDSQNFLSNLCKEVSLRLQGCGVQGRTFTLKIKKRRKDAGEPVKYMGCGDCENLSHSLTVPLATDDVEVLQRITKQLFGFFNLDVKEIRGIGLQVSKLENADPLKQGPEKNSLTSWLKSTSANTEEQKHNHALLRKKAAVDGEGPRTGVPDRTCEEIIVANLIENNPSSAEFSLSLNSAPPSLSDLDFGVIGSLPPEIFSELNEIYEGKLVDFVAKSKSKGKGKMKEGEEVHFNRLAHPVKLQIDEKGKQQKDDQEMPFLGGFQNLDVPDVDVEKTDLMPSSLSQIDTLVLEQLPQELRVDILGQLPAHRKPVFSSSSSPSPSVEHPQESVADFNTENHLKSNDSVSDCELWVGSPPKWVDEFSESKCSILNVLAKMFYKLGSAVNLSSVLRYTFLESQHLSDAGYECWNEASSSFSEVLMQYVKLKIKLDMEEIYICFRLLQRFKSKSKFLLQVYDTVYPYLQASVNESYGGNLHLPAG